MSGNYLAQGFKSTLKTYKKNKTSMLSFIFLSISSIIGKMFLITAPVFQMMDLSLAEDAAESSEFNMFEGFRDSDIPKSVWMLSVLNIIKGIFILSGVGLIVLLTTFLYFAGLKLGEFTTVNNMELYFIIPSAITALIFVSFILTVFSPFTYIVRNVKTRDLFNVLYNNRISMNFKLFSKIFFINCIYYLVMIGLPVLVGFVYLKMDISFLGILALVGLGLVYLVIFGYMLMSRNIALYLLFKENVSLDATKIKQENNVDKTSDEQKLSHVFNDSNALN